MNQLPDDIIDCIAHWLPTPRALYNLAMVRPFNTKYVWFKDATKQDLIWACKHGDVELANSLKYLGIDSVYNVLSVCIRRNDIKMFKWVCESFSFDITTFQLSLLEHRIEIVKYIINNHPVKLTYKLVDLIMETNDTDCIRWVVETHPVVYPKVVYKVFESGCMDLVKTLCKTHNITEYLCEAVYATTNWEIFTWLAINYELPNVRLADLRTLAMAQWYSIQFNHTPYYSETLQMYVRYGSIAMIEWADQLVGKKPKHTRLMNLALERGDMDVVLWVWENYYEGTMITVPDNLFHQMCCDGNLELLQWCYAMSLNNYHRNLYVTSYYVCIYDHCETMKWLYDTFSVTVPHSTYFDLGITKLLIEYCDSQPVDFYEVTQLSNDKYLDKTKYLYDVMKPKWEPCFNRFSAIHAPKTLMWAIETFELTLDQIVQCMYNDYTYLFANIELVEYIDNKYGLDPERMPVCVMEPVVLKYLKRRGYINNDHC